MATNVAPLTPRTEHRTQIVELFKIHKTLLTGTLRLVKATTLNTLNALQDAQPPSQTAAKLFKSAEEYAFSAQTATQAALLSRDVIDPAMQEYFKIGGSLKQLAEALHNIPAKRDQFVEAFTPTYREHSPHPDEL